MRRTSVPSLRNQNNNNQQPRSTTTITHPTNRNRPSTQTAQYVQGQQDYLPSTPLGDMGHKKKEPCLHFRRGTVIEVITRDAVSGWWHGQYENLRGWFPSHFVGRVSHLDTGMGSNDAIQKELNAWKATMIDQQKNRTPPIGSGNHGVGGISGIYKKNSNLVSPSNDTLVKVKYKQRHNGIHHQFFLLLLLLCFIVLITINDDDKISLFLFFYFSSFFFFRGRH